MAQAMLYVACAATALISVFLVLSSLKRYVQGTPLMVTEEATALFFVVVSCLCLPAGFVSNRHIRLALLWGLLPSPLKDWLEILGQLIALVILAILVHVTWSFAALSYDLGSATTMTSLILWPWMALVPVSFVLVGACIITRVLRSLLRLNGRMPPDIDDKTPSIQRDLV